MHKVINFGSALQAWALQTAVQKMGFDALLIDYKYPNDYYYKHAVQISQVKHSVWKKIRVKKLIHYIKLKLYKRQTQIQRFQEFWNHNFRMTCSYESLDNLKSKSPNADIYMTGSDQIWNPNTMYGDPAFFLNFGDKQIPRISYAASFGTNEINSIYSPRYADYLSKYTTLGVREKSGRSIIKHLLNRDATLVCDPTFLLTAEDYKHLYFQSRVHINKPYLLAYILDYAYNPYPAIDNVISEVSKMLGLHVVYLLCGNVNGYKLGSTTVSDAGPNEFVRLFSDAKFVVTSSFHGTAFSLIHRKSFYSILPAEDKDSRIASFLKELQLDSRGIKANQTVHLSSDELLIDYGIVESSIVDYRSKSLEFLRNSLSQC